MGGLLFSAATAERKEVALTTSGNVVRKLGPSVIIRDQSSIKKKSQREKYIYKKPTRAQVPGLKIRDLILFSFHYLY